MANYKVIGEKDKKIIIIVLIIIVVLVLMISSITTIKAGEVGIKTRFGKVINIQLNEGLNFKIPFIEKINKISIKVAKIEIESDAASKDLQNVKINLAVNYKVIPTQAPNLFRNIGINYQEIILAPAIQESIKSATSLYTAEELITKRSEVSAKTKELLEEKVKKYGLTIEDFNITNFNFSPEFNKAIEDKQIAEQKVLKSKKELEQAKIDAEKKVTEAKADADALKLQKQYITKDLIELRKIDAQLEAIKKWDGKLPNYTGGSIPFINVN